MLFSWRCPRLCSVGLRALSANGLSKATRSNRSAQRRVAAFCTNSVMRKAEPSCSSRQGNFRSKPIPRARTSPKKWFQNLPSASLALLKLKIISHTAFKSFVLENIGAAPKGVSHLFRVGRAHARSELCAYRTKHVELTLRACLNLDNPTRTQSTGHRVHLIPRR